MNRLHFLLLITLVLLAGGLDESISFGLIPILTTVGLSKSWLGVIAAAGGLGALAFILPAGFLSDRVRARYIAAAGFCTLGIAALFLYSGVQHALTFFLLFAAIGAGLQGATLALDVSFYKHITSTLRGKALGYFGAGKRFVAGGVAFLCIAAATSVAIGGAFGLIALLSFTMAFLALFLPANDTFQVAFSDYRKELASPVVRSFLLLIILFYLHAGGDGVAAPWIWREEMGLSYFQFALLGGGGIAIFTAGMFAIGAQLADRTTASRSFAIIGLILSALGHIGIGFADTFWLTALARAVHLIGDGLFMLFYTTEIAWLYSRKTLGGQLGVVAFTMYASIMTSKLLVGFLGDAFGFRMTLFGTGGIMLLAALYVAVWGIEFTKREIEPGKVV